MFEKFRFKLIRKLLGEDIPIVGRRRVILKTMRGAVCVKYEVTPWVENLIVNGGKDSIFRRIQKPGFGGDGISGGGTLADVGVGTSTTAPNVLDTDLLGASKLWKAITESVYVRPTLYSAATFGYSEANFAWNEYGVRDSNGTLVSRSVEGGTVLTKNITQIAILEWQYTL